MTIQSSIHAYLEKLTAFCRESRQRKMVVFSGQADWCHDQLQSLHCDQFLAITIDTHFDDLDTQCPDKLHLLLGKEYEGIIWDGFSGLNPDGLGIASGLLKGGGIFFLLLPPLNDLKNKADPDYSRMCSDDLKLADFNTFFLQRLIQHLESSSHCSLFEQDKTLDTHRLTDPKQADQVPILALPSDDQHKAIAAIKRVAFGHRNRPLVIKANRGRGKSSALGIAAAEIFLERGFKTVITAPSKKTCRAAFEHFQTHIKIHTNAQPEQDELDTALTFLPLDELLHHDIDAHILFIDEAAAIPTSILSALLDKFSRLVYSTTQHGYEGNGQGFAIRFKKHLDIECPQWQSITLHTPIRWLNSDTLEPWFFRFLLLDAQLPSLHHGDELRQFTWLSQATLYQDDDLFEHIIALLVSAHYQTSPSDIRLILDHPHIKILVAHAPYSEGDHIRTLYGVCLVIQEGGLSSETLANDIIQGKRRPRGHLFPQALCASSANPLFMSQSTYRVMRIAVHPDVQQKGIGSDMLNELKTKAQDHQIDSLSTSYGLSTELLWFWQKNNFQTVKLGAKVDGASGLRSIMMMQALSAPAKQLLNKHRKAFLRHFIFNLNRQHKALPTAHVCLIIHSLAMTESRSQETSSHQEHATPSETNKDNAQQKIVAFANAARQFEETHLELFEWLIDTIVTTKWHKISDDTKELLVSQILQNRNSLESLKRFNLSGKKQRLTALRKAVRELLSLTLNTEA